MDLAFNNKLIDEGTDGDCEEANQESHGEECILVYLFGLALCIVVDEFKVRLGQRYY